MIASENNWFMIWEKVERFALTQASYRKLLCLEKNVIKVCMILLRKRQKNNAKSHKRSTKHRYNNWTFLKQKEKHGILIMIRTL